MTCGAGGALNVIFKTILNPGDEVVSPAPYFVEYNFYTDNHGGSLCTVPSRPDFTLDLDALAGAITQRTKAVIINSPNNPTGAIFPAEQIRQLGALLEERSRALGHTIYLVSDEPYRKIVYDGAVVPPIFPYYTNSIIANSYSKELSLAGERIGYLALNPNADEFAEVMNGLVFSNRVLGFVNAPATMQRLVARLKGTTVDVERYRAKRDLLYAALVQAGFTVAKPAGAFYLFPRSPIEDDVAFVRELQNYRILAVPGSGFGGPGYFRLAYCVSDTVIRGAGPVFRKVGEAHLKR
jgi:aspartate aminotransferase